MLEVFVKRSFVYEKFDGFRYSDILFYVLWFDSIDSRVEVFLLPRQPLKLYILPYSRSWQISNKGTYDAILFSLLTIPLSFDYYLSTLQSYIALQLTS